MNVIGQLSVCSRLETVTDIFSVQTAQKSEAKKIKIIRQLSNSKKSSLLLFQIRGLM